jgi:hypothetical protein
MDSRTPKEEKTGFRIRIQAKVDLAGAGRMLKAMCGAPLDLVGGAMVDLIGTCRLRVAAIEM